MIFPDIRKTIESLAGIKSSVFSTGEAQGFQWYGLRQADYTKKCSCVSTQGIKDSVGCSRCFMTGYLFTDFLVKGYSWMGILGVEYGALPGLLSTQQRNVVVRHNRAVNKFDYILELDQNFDTGEIKQPFKILKYYRIQDSMSVKGDSGRIEFWKCAVEERNISDGRPGPEGPASNYGSNRGNNEPQ